MEQRSVFPESSERERTSIFGCVSQPDGDKNPSTVTTNIRKRRRSSANSDQVISIPSENVSVTYNDIFPSISDDSSLFKKSLTPNSALKRYEDRVSNLNREELMSYGKIYFVGTEMTAENRTEDKSASCKFVPRSHVAYRYEILESLGEGGFGVVYKALDHKEKRLVALKVLQTKIYDDSFEHRIELAILEYLKVADTDNTGNVVKFYENFMFRNNVCTTFELLSISLSEYIKRNRRQGCDLQTVKSFACSILQGLSFLSENGIVHGDLKPGNIMLLQPDGHDVKIIDFGMSFFVDMGPIVANFGTRNYRAPEIIFRASYDLPIDMWSFGCILAELFTGRGLFNRTDDFSLFADMVEILGMLPDNQFSKSRNYSCFMDEKGLPRYLSVNSGNDCDHVPKVICGPPKSRPLSLLLEGSKCQQFIDLVSACLEWDPLLRCRASQAFDHAWFAGLTEI